MIIHTTSTQKNKQGINPQETLEISLEAAKEKRCALRAEIFHAHTIGDKITKQKLSGFFNELTDLIDQLTINQLILREEKVTEEPQAPKETPFQNTISNDTFDPHNHPTVNLSLIEEPSPKSPENSIKTRESSGFFIKIKKILNLFTHNKNTKRKNQ